MIKLRLAFLLAMNCFALSAFCQTYITNVTIVDVVNQKLIPAQTVVIKNGIISNIGLPQK
jgi:adenine deaminase